MHQELYYVGRSWENRDRDDTPMTSRRLPLVGKTADLLANDH